MKAILILMDTLNRNFLSTYGAAGVNTPNMDRLAKRSVVFDNHWVASAPCMPARRDILTGRLEFLERPWGPLEPYDITLTKMLRENDIFTHMITDHYHYFEPSGEHYCQTFNTWDFIRGQEHDPWVSRVGTDIMIYPGMEGYEEIMKSRINSGSSPQYGVFSSQYELNKTKYSSGEGFPCTRTFKSTCEWIEENKDADQYFLMVEAFDPHEPFDCPDEYKKMYDEGYEEPDFKWPSYRKTEEPEDAVRQLRRNYMANLSYADACLGKLLDCLDENNMWEDTLIIFTTDHGHMLGEHGFTGKNVMPFYNECAHIPLMIHLPGDKKAGERIGALTQNIDIYPTVLDHFTVPVNHSIHGMSWMSLLEGNKEYLRDSVIYGVFGSNVNITDGTHTYFRAHANKDNKPLYAYTATPSTFVKYWDEKYYPDIECGRFLDYTSFPVYKVPFPELWFNERFLQYSNCNMLFDIQEDYEQLNNLTETKAEEKYIKLLIDRMKDFSAPEEQYIRLGLV